MSEEQQAFGKESIEQSQNYSPMPLAVPDPPKDYDDIDVSQPISPEDAGKFLVERRAETERVTQEPIERRYNHQGGPNNGEAMPEHQTVELDRAGRDLAGVREAEQAAEKTAADLELQQAIDQLRSGQPEPQQPQPEQQPAQPEQPVLGEEDVWQNPKIIEGVTQYTNQMNGAFQQLQQQYVNELSATAAQTVQLFASQYPELAGLQTADQIRGAMAAIEQQNPQRGAQLRTHIDNVIQISAKAQEVQQQQFQAQQQQHRQQFDHVAKQADDAYSKWIAQQEPSPERQKEISATAHQMLRDFGLNDQEIDYHWSTNPILRSFAGQQILADAARYRMNKAAARDKQYRAIPTVQRPGAGRVEQGTQQDWNYSRANAELDRTGSVKAAAALLQQRRARQ